MRHVVCLIHRDHLTIERNGAAIGNVYELFGEPTIQLNNASNGQVVRLTQNDTEMIWDCWNAMKELQRELPTALDNLQNAADNLQNALDKLPKFNKLSV